jgi:hypothetical protein
MCIENFKRTGYGRPDKVTGTSPDNPGPTVAATTRSTPSVPAMPTILTCRKTVQQHRTIIPDSHMDIYQTCVARTFTTKEASVTPEAMKALDKEWTKLEKQVA